METPPYRGGGGVLPSASRRSGDAALEPKLIASPTPGQGSPAGQAVSLDEDADALAPSALDIARGEPMLPLVLRRLDEDQADDVVSIDLTGKSDMADALVIASGRNQRHVGALADKVLRDLKEAGYGQAKVEGLPACDWVLIDGGDVVVHLFWPEVRDFYKLERIWAPERFQPASEEAAEDAEGAPATDAGTDTRAAGL